jgi:hypothetical protein
MKIIQTSFMLVAFAIACVPPGYSDEKKSRRQPVPEAGFWVTESGPETNGTIVRYYANSTYQVAEKVEPAELSIKKTAVRRQLNKNLKIELEKDSASMSLPKLYEID